ncbi:MAG: 4Fe-4S dicluster domain-containing protein [Desulfamplus sp.]|nr:4Fe-4S dicluster domain-containing protein [Desulfamplus sp.]
MDSLTQKIREIASNILKEGKVEMVIGFAKGTLPMTTKPYMARTPEQVENFIWDKYCTLNLANYITGRKEKIGIIAKGCDSRNIVNHIVENKISRDQLYIIGVPCSGMADKNNPDRLRDNCSTCTHRNPVIFDVMVAEPVDEQKLDDQFADVKAIEAMDKDAKWGYFEGLLQNCIRCYACRNACPLCYCPTCFVDESNPQWVGKGQNKTDILTFHFLRAFHCAGRCTDCGACEAACPMDIHVRAFTRKLNKDALELFGWEAGLDTSKRPPLDTFNIDDPNDFIK